MRVPPVIRTRRRAIFEIKICTKIESDQFPRIGLYELALVVHRQRRLDIGNREIHNDRVRRLAVTDLYTLVSAIAGSNYKCCSEKSNNVSSQTIGSIRFKMR